MLDHPYFHGLDDTEAHLNWTRLEALMDEIYASTAGSSELSLADVAVQSFAGIWYKLSDERLAAKPGARFVVPAFLSP